MLSVGKQVMQMIYQCLCAEDCPVGQMDCERAYGIYVGLIIILV